MQIREKEQQLELDEEQEKTSMKHWLIQDIKEEMLKPGNMQIEKWSICSDVVKYVQYNQYPIGHYELEVKEPEVRFGTKRYKNFRIVKKRSRK